MIGIHITLNIIPIHAGMIPGNHNGRVLIKILFLQPGNEFRQLPAGAGIDVLILLCMFFAAQRANVTTDMMCIHRQHGKSKRLFPFRHLSDFFLRIFIEIQIFHAPPDPVILIDQACFPSRKNIIDRLYTMVLKIPLASTEVTVRAYHQGLCITFRMQKIVERRGTGKNRRAFSKSIIIRTGRKAQRQARSLCSHGRNRPSCPRNCAVPAHTLCL